MSPRRTGTAAAALAGGLLALPVWAMAQVPATSSLAVAAAASSDESRCSEAIAQAERAHPNLPRGLLQAIGNVESGRATRGGRLQPWPYTTNIDGNGQYSANLEAAVSLVTAAFARGARAIDVGCMQISLRHHPTAFANIAEGFVPERNVAYAVRFLQSLYEKTGSWTSAIARYHSGDPVRQGEYLARVRTAWNGLDGQAAAAVLAATDGPAMPTAAAGRSDPQAGMHRARQLFAAGDHAGAQAICRSHRAQAAFRTEATYCLALAAEGLGRGEEAFEHYLELLQHEPTDGAALRNVMRLALAHGVPGPGWERKAQWKSPRDAVPLLLTLARARLPDSKTYLKAAARASEGDLRTQTVIAMEHEAAGELQQARELYARLLPIARANAPTLAPPLQERLERLAALEPARDDAGPATGPGTATPPAPAARPGAGTPPQPTAVSAPPTPARPPDGNT